jgi:hypothetical protein
VQEWVAGPDTDLYTCNCYFDRRGEQVVSFVTRKLRQWPPAAGTGCFGVEVRNDAVSNLAAELFRRTEFRGLGYIEVKHDRTSDKYYLIEANVGRPTGRSATAEAAGVELIHTVYCDALEQPLPANRVQRYLGVKWIDIRKDVRAAMHMWRRGDLQAVEWLRSLRGPKAHAVLSWTDPVPFFADVLSAAVRGTGANLRRGVFMRRAPSSRPCAEPRRTICFDIHGLVAVQLVDAPPLAVQAFTDMLGNFQPGPAPRSAAITIRFVGRFDLDDVQVIDGGRIACTAGQIYMRRRAARGGWTRVPIGEFGKACEFVCESDVVRVPLFDEALRAAIIACGYVPLHGSAFEWQGNGIVVVGRAHGGKTSALLSFARAGARYISDDFVILAPDGSAVRGLSAPLCLSSWHLGQLPHLHGQLQLGQRAYAGALKSLEASTRAVPSVLRRVVRHTLSRMGRRGKRAMDIDLVFPTGAVTAAAPAAVVLMKSASGTTTAVSEVTPDALAAIMEEERLLDDAELRRVYKLWRSAVPQRRNDFLEGLSETTSVMIVNALGGLAAFTLTHPCPSRFEDLLKAMEPLLRADSLAMGRGSRTASGPLGRDGSGAVHHASCAPSTQDAAAAGVAVQ